MSRAISAKNAAQSSAIVITAVAGKQNGQGGKMTEDNGMLGPATSCGHAESAMLKSCYVCPRCDTVTLRTSIADARSELLSLVEADHASTDIYHRALRYLSR